MRHVQCVLSTSALRLASITKNILKKKMQKSPSWKIGSYVACATVTLQFSDTGEPLTEDHSLC